MGQRVFLNQDKLDGIQGKSGAIELHKYRKLDDCP